MSYNIIFKNMFTKLLIRGCNMLGAYFTGSKFESYIWYGENLGDVVNDEEEVFKHVLWVVRVSYKPFKIS